MVVVDHAAGKVLEECVASLPHDLHVVVVDNAVPPGRTRRALEMPGADDTHPTDDTRSAHDKHPAHHKHPPVWKHDVDVIEVGANLGYGSGANRGAAACTAEFVLVSNPDIVFEPQTLGRLADVLRARPDLGIVGPRVNEPDGTRYPSARRFPSLLEGAGHALAGLLAPNNRFTRRYRMVNLETQSPESPESSESLTEVDWVSGSCMLVRRKTFEELGGFDESYFMYGEDVDLCWRAHRAGWGVAYVPGASVTHVGGFSTRQTPYRMIAAHHRSTLRFASRTLAGPKRLALPGIALALSVRFAMAVVREPFRKQSGGQPGGQSAERQGRPPATEHGGFQTSSQVTEPGSNAGASDQTAGDD
ncbi:MAG: glycosyltransferase family 2 protein [Acidimicrobiales bacterium]